MSLSRLRLIQHDRNSLIRVEETSILPRNKTSNDEINYTKLLQKLTLLVKFFDSYCNVPRMNAFQQVSPLMARHGLYKSPVLWVFVATLAVLAIHPIPECIACEYARPWGRNDAAYAHASVILNVWLVVASLTAGFCSLRKYWLVPIAIVVAHLITQPIGGVALWSLWSNEGPMIVLFGSAVGLSSLLTGAVIRLAIARPRTTSNAQ